LHASRDACRYWSRRATWSSASIEWRNPAALPAWITDAAGSTPASFNKGIVAGRGAVAAPMAQPWPNGQTEGLITKLKLVKRQM